MDDLSLILEIKKDDLTKYELTLLAARRARQINGYRVALQKRFELPLVEKDKPTNFALRELAEGRIGFTFSKEVLVSRVRETKRF